MDAREDKLERPHRVAQGSTMTTEHTEQSTIHTEHCRIYLALYMENALCTLVFWVLVRC